MNYFPLVVEQEDSGVWSAWVAGEPVYAQGATKGKALLALSRTLRAYLVAHPDARPRATVSVAAVDKRSHVSLVDTAALLGRRTSARKAAAARANGRLGGRPRHT